MNVVMRFVCGLGAAASLLVAFAHPHFRSATGSLTGAIAVPLGVATALVLCAWCRASGKAAFLVLAGLFTVGQGVTLQLVRAGTAIGYQHWVSPSELMADHPGTVLFLLAQVVIIGVVAYRRRAAWRDHALPSMAGLVVVAFLFVITAAAPSRQPLAYATETAVVVFVQFVQLLNVLLAIAVLPRGSLKRAAESTSWLVRGSPAGQRDRFVLGAAAWALAVTVLLTVFVYEQHPHIPDEIGYLVQGRYFSRGLLSLPAPPVPEAFHLYMFALDAERWYSAMPPGWPLVLGLGILAGVVWLVNPLLTAVNVILTHNLLRALYGPRTARLGVLLLCLSPWFIFMGMSAMNHQWALTCALLAAMGMHRLVVGRRLSPFWVLAAGLALGMLSAIRPLEALAAALLLGGASLLGGHRRGWRRLVPASSVAAVSIFVSIPQLLYNRYFTGRAARFPVMEFLEAQYGPGTNALGFGPGRGFGWTGLDPFPGHGVFDVIVNSMLNLSQVNTELHGWGIGSLLVLALFVVFGRKRRADWLMIAAIAAIVGSHSLYWFSGGPDFGARYWYLILVPCLVLTARGLPVLGRLAGVGRTGGVLAALVLSLSATAVFMPWRAADKYYRYRGMTPEIRHLAEEFGSALVLIRGPLWPDYASASIYNPLDLTARVPVFARDAGPEPTAELLRHYADRDVWVLEGPSLTGDGYRVIAGPVPAHQMLEDSSRTATPGTP